MAFTSRGLRFWFIVNRLLGDLAACNKTRAQQSNTHEQQGGWFRNGRIWRRSKRSGVRVGKTGRSNLREDGRNCTVCEADNLCAKYSATV